MSDRVAALAIVRDPQDAERVRGVFARAGFAVGPYVGISFSIESTRELMEAWLPDFSEREGSGAELSLERLPDDVRSAVQAVVSEAPPDFGPTSW